MIYLQNIQPTNLLNLNVKQKYLILGSNEKSITLKSTGLPILLYRPRSTPLLYISHTGFCCRNKLIFSSKISHTLSISSSVVDLPRLNLIEDLASASERPIASSTCDGSGSADVHPDSDETEITSFTCPISCSPSTSLKQRLATCGRRDFGSPFT